MKPLPGNLICTVGTSLVFPNLKFLNPDTKYQAPPRANDIQGLADWEALGRMRLLDDPARLKTLLTEIRTALEAVDFPRLAALLTQLPPELRLLGAEINSIDAMIRKGFLPENRMRLILFVSDTADGVATGRILSNYFERPDCPVGFEKCLTVTVGGLQDEKPLLFQRDGLTNLVRMLGDEYRKWGGSIAINATGGYKAQIAFAVAFGQATGTPVYYKHERFDQIIRFPQIPFTLDLSFVENHLKLWADLAEPDASFDEDAIQNRLGVEKTLQEAIYPLLDWIEDDGVRLFSLSALGLVYWEAFRSMNPSITLKPKPVSLRRGVHFRDDHYPVGFKAHVRKFYDTFEDLVIECHSLPYDRQPSIRNRFYSKNQKIIGEYKDRDGFGARFEAVTSAENALERGWLIEKFRQWTAGGEP
jgi:putative CRISPR-associated protein (TIGR02619 family)